MRFSERIGKRPIRSALQLESMDSGLKSKLWNLVYLRRLASMPYRFSEAGEERILFFRSLWHQFFKQPIDTIPWESRNAVSYIRSWYDRAVWHDVYDLIEFLVAYEDDADAQSTLVSAFNEILEEEMAGYRIINKQVTPITDEHEIREIELAIENAKKLRLRGVTEHIETALDKLADRANPDFRNSIKESISAVEGIAKLITGKPKADLDDALKAIERQLAIHPALRKAFLAIYGYTSDSDGIRHSMAEQSQCDFEDAKYMLVSCSAFVNYLVVKSAKAKIHIS